MKALSQRQAVSSLLALRRAAQCRAVRDRGGADTCSRCFLSMRVPPFADSSAHLTIASKRSRSSSSSSGRCRVMAGNIYRERRRAEGLARLRKLRMRRRSKNMTISLPVLSRSLRLWQSWFRPCCLEFAIRSVFRIAAGFLRPAVEPIPGDHAAFFTHLVHEVVTAVKLRRIS